MHFSSFNVVMIHSRVQSINVSADKFDNMTFIHFVVLHKSLIHPEVAID